MSFSSHEEQRGERILDVLTDDDTGLRIVVSRLGAELISLARRSEDGEWTGFLHRDNDLTAAAKGWGNHATVMGYFLHRLKDGRSLYRGQEIAGGTHSFLRGKEWHFDGSQAGKGILAYEIGQADFTPNEYPLNVSLRLSYQLDGEQVRVTFLFQNHEAELSAHVGYGLHPGFAARSFESFRFEMPVGLYRRHCSPNNYLSGETEDIRFAGGAMPFAREKLPGSYILELVDVPKRNFVFSDPSSRREVTLDLAGVPYLTLWSDGGAFLCIEPCWGLTDHDEQRAFEDKEGIQVIAPAGKIDTSFAMRPRLR